jgi:ribosome-associated heat shock protein Hsp15
VKAVENRPVPVRLDLWLDVACLFRTRSEAQKACKGGKVTLNGYSAKAHRDVKVGDVVEISRPQGRRQRVVVKQVTDRHVAKAQARELYEDTTPPPSPEETQMRDFMRLVGPPRRAAAGTPDRRERRRLRREKQGDAPE